MEKVTLSLNKETIVKLNSSEMVQMKGGGETNNYYSCWIWQTCKSVCINTCVDTCVCSVGTGMCC